MTHLSRLRQDVSLNFTLFYSNDCSFRLDYYLTFPEQRKKPKIINRQIRKVCTTIIFVSLILYTISGLVSFPNNWLRMSWPLTLTLTLHHYSYISKCSIPTAPQTFSPMPTSYWALNSWATFNVIGILNRNAYTEHAQEVQSCKTLFATRFICKFWIPALTNYLLKRKQELTTSSRRHPKSNFANLLQVVWARYTSSLIQHWIHVCDKWHSFHLSVLWTTAGSNIQANFPQLNKHQSSDKHKTIANQVRSDNLLIQISHYCNICIL